MDVLYGIGGAPEGVVSAAVIRAMDGDMQARLLARHQVKGDSAENRRLGEQELARCAEMGINAGEVLTLQQMARNDNVIFAATGITTGDLLKGITRRAISPPAKRCWCAVNRAPFAAFSQSTIWTAKTQRCTLLSCNRLFAALRMTRERPPAQQHHQRRHKHQHTEARLIVLRQQR